MSNAPRNTATRDRHRAAIKRAKPPCGICGQPIDYTLPYLDPLSFEVDHVIAINNGGPDTLDNKQASHRRCNRLKWDTTGEVGAPRTYTTHRKW